MEQRPDPDKLLEKIKQSEQEHVRGKLKIFFGYAAGVGKTYAMLDAAHAAQRNGIDVVVGYVEPHIRPETLKLLEGIEILPNLEIEYKGITLREFDLDYALKRKPQLILVDELAHTNAYNCRHTKRYMDIEEILQAGIDVYTTVNVQHLESLNDIVASITEVVVKERIPDKIFDEADQIELVDIAPDELLYRLKEGKIYKKERVQNALENFFTKENLVALREITLRRTADRVNREAEFIKDGVQKKDYSASEHILVCLSTSPSNAKVIRTAARMASAFRAPLTALFVETPATKVLESKNKIVLRENIRLAEQFGAKIATVYGDDIAMQIAEYAKVSGISKIVIGRSNNRVGMLRIKSNFIERLIAFAPQMDIYIIPDLREPYKKKKSIKREEFSLVDSLKMIGILVTCLLIGMVFDQIGLRESNIITVFILGVLLSAVVTTGRIYGLITSIIAALIFNFFFTYPQFTFHAYDAGYPITFMIMIASSLITSSLTIRGKRQAKESAEKAYRTEVLLETSQKLQRAYNQEDIMQQIATQITKLIDMPIIIYPNSGERLGEARCFAYPGTKTIFDAYIDCDEFAVAEWVFKNKVPAGKSTNTLPGAKVFYLPIRDGEQVFAVVGIIMEEQEGLETFEQSLLIAMLNQASFALEKNKLDQMNKQIELEAEQEKLRANLLRTISHDLRTPLTSISGNASILVEKNDQISSKVRNQMCESIYRDSIWLINLVENLLAVTRVEDGMMQLRLQSELVDDILGEAISHIKYIKLNHVIETRIEDELLMVRVDARLIVQVIFNMIDNAIKYTPSGSTIILSAKKLGNKVVIEVADTGTGIPDCEKEKVFDMFYTANNKIGDGRRGLGLGLALCKSIVIAHGGEIYIRDNKPKGAVFGLILICEEIRIDETDNFDSGR